MGLTTATDRKNGISWEAGDHQAWFPVRQEEEGAGAENVVSATEGSKRPVGVTYRCARADNNTWGRWLRSSRWRPRAISGNLSAHTRGIRMRNEMRGLRRWSLHNLRAVVNSTDHLPAIIIVRD